jgi:hypothetical protein
MELSIGNVYTIDTVAPAVLGARFARVKLNGIVGYETAKNFINAIDIHKVVYPMIPAGASLNAKSLTYYIFNKEDGTTLVLARDWINLNTIVLVTSITAQITVTLDSGTETENIRKALLALGYTNFTVDIV